MTAFGDTGYSTNFVNNLNLVKTLNPDFHMHLGDMTYSNTKTSVDTFAAEIVAALGATPYMLTAGNHESNWNDYLTDFPPPVPITGSYGIRYYFNWPLSSPYCRIIAITAGITEISGVDGNYSAGTANYNWVHDRIAEAKANGWWVIVCVHKNWISMGTKGNEVGNDIMALCFTMGVDLMLQGHDHTYQRSKQWNNPVVSGHPTIVGNGPQYVKGLGLVLTINGSGGLNHTSLSSTDPDVPYFADNPNGFAGKAAFNNDYGTLALTVTPTTISAAYHQLGKMNADVYSVG